MKTQITKIGAFKGTKLTMSNITVRKYIDSMGQLYYIIFKGKGTGSQMTATKSFDVVETINANLNQLTTRTIYSLKDGTMGAGLFLNDTMLMANEHPFVQQGGYTFNNQ